MRVLLQVPFCQARHISLAGVGVIVIFSFMLEIYCVLLQLFDTAVGGFGCKQLRLQVARGVLARVLAAQAYFLQRHTSVPALNPIIREDADKAVFRVSTWYPFIPLIKLFLLVRWDSSTRGGSSLLTSTCTCRFIDTKV